MGSCDWCRGRAGRGAEGSVARGGCHFHTRRSFVESYKNPFRPEGQASRLSRRWHVGNGSGVEAQIPIVPYSETIRGDFAFASGSECEDDASEILERLPRT